MTKLLNRLIYLTLLSTLTAAPLLAQNIFQQKDLVFPQVAVSADFDSVITLTNRGAFPYSGLFFFRTGNGELWNPTVNGQAGAEGQLAVSIQADQTITLRLTGVDLVTGIAVLISDDLALDNFVEGNLTYFLRSSGKVVDSVGIAPSREFYLSSLPFEDFSAIALALTNVDLAGQNSAEVQLNLLTDDGTLLDSTTVRLEPFEHRARFLFELFPGIQLTRGKLEIASFFPICGVALTSKNKQLSSLPLEPAPVTYTVRMVDSDSTVYTGTLALWAEGFFVRGYLVISTYQESGKEEVTLESPVLNLLNGQLFSEQGNPALRLSFYMFSDAFFGEPATIYFQHGNFSIFDELASGTWTVMFLSDKATMEGTFEFTRTSL